MVLVCFIKPSKIVRSEVYWVSRCGSVPGHSNFGFISEKSREAVDFHNVANTFQAGQCLRVRFANV